MLQIGISEILYYIVLLCFMGSKAIGLSEGQWPFTLAIVLGVIAFTVKLMVTHYEVRKWILNILLISLGLIVYCVNGHIELLLSVLLVIGMKDVKLDRAVRVCLTIWGILFVMTVIRALLGIYPGYISTQSKVGMGFGIIRYSLGFTHQNVLHITFFIIAVLAMYCIGKEKKKVLYLSLILFIGNIYIFMYSFSYTGFIVVNVCLLLNMFFLLKKSMGKFISAAMVIFVSMCFLLPIVGRIILPNEIFDVLDRVINSRLSLSADAFETYGITLFGTLQNSQAGIFNLDSSYSYVLFYQGAIAFLIFFLSFVYALIINIKRRQHASLAAMLGIALSGVTEQYLGNLSFKNVSLLFIGDAIYNSKESEDISKMVSFDGLIVLKNRIANYFKGTRYVKCILPSIMVALITMFGYSSICDIPKHIYYVDNSNSGSYVCDYTEDMREQLEIENSIIVGNLYDGCRLSEDSWVNFELEHTRGMVSAFLWSFLITFFVCAFLLNLRKFDLIYIEDPILEEQMGDKLPPITTCNILGVNVAVSNMQRMVSYFKENLSKLRGKYVCVSNVHTIVTSFENEDYMDVQNRAAIVFPDGKPLSLVSRRRGYVQADRVAGPDFMTEIFRISSQEGFRHFFFGGTEETLAKLRKNLEVQYPGINIVGMYSPKFYDSIDSIPPEDDTEHIEIIKKAKPDFIWIGLGAPKQERWMSRHENMFEGVMLGVGAGFDFHAGTVKRAPKIMQALYLEWLYRLLQDPKRLFRRYFSTNLKFVMEVHKESKELINQSIEKSKKNLLIYAHYYYPDVASTGQILTELAEGLRDSFDISVISVVPSYSGKVEEKYQKYRYYLQEVRGVKVYRVRVPEFTKLSKISRARNILSYYRYARHLTKKVGAQDCILSISQPPILGGMLGVYGKRVKRAKFVYNIQDFNPEQIKSVGYSKNGILLNAMQYLDNRSCRCSDLIITVGRDLGETIEKRFAGKSVPKYEIINNWINERNIYPLPDDNLEVRRFREAYGLLNKFVFMYSGNIGLYYDLENLLSVIKKIPKDTVTNDNRQVVFAFVGDGGLKPGLEKYVRENDMDNVAFIPYQDKDKLIYSLNAGDVHICINAPGIKGVSCPSKYYGIAAIGKPILASLEPQSEIRCLIEETQGGLISTPGENDELLSNIWYFINNADNSVLSDMGMRSRNKLLSDFTCDVSINKYREAIEKL